MSLLAAVTGQREGYLAYWLDLYYQVRAAYERGREPPPLRREDLIPAVREIWEEMLEAQTLEAFVIPGTLGEKCATDPSEREPRAEEVKAATVSSLLPPQAAGEKAAGTPSAASGPPPPTKRGTPPPAKREAEGAGDKKPGAWTIYKRNQLDRLRAAREAGLTLARIEKTDPALTVRTVTNMLGGQYATRNSWKALENALDAWEKENADCRASGRAGTQ